MELHQYAGGYDPALHHAGGLEKNKYAGRHNPELHLVEDTMRNGGGKKELGKMKHDGDSASHHAHAAAEGESRRLDSGDGRTHSWLMADLMRGLDARRRKKTNGKFVPALEPRRRMEKQSSQAKCMVSHVFTICVSRWCYCFPLGVKFAYSLL